MSSHSSLDPADVARFADIADQWWDPDGKFSPLHRLNPVRLAFIRERCLDHFSADGGARSPFRGRRLLDIGCGGGLVAEPMTRLGFQVTAVDAATESISVAVAHAEGQNLPIDFRQATAEALRAQGEMAFDVVLALEIVEHVADPRAFIADCAQLTAPGGLMILSTLNRTLRSLALAKIAAEYLLHWVPAGAHDWRRFLAPAELHAFLSAAGLVAGEPVGLVLNPFTGVWKRSADTRVNYMMSAAQPETTLN